MRMLSLGILFIAFVSCQTLDAKHASSFTAKGILSANKGWIVVEDKENRMSFERVKKAGDNPAGIYIEIADAQQDQMSSQFFVKNLIETYSSVYDDINFTAVKKNNVEYFVINHAILKENKKLETTIIPKGGVYYLIVVYGVNDDFTTAKLSYDQVVNSYLVAVFPERN